MSMWKDQSSAKKDAPLPPAPEVERDVPAAAQFTPTVTAPPAAAVARDAKESLISADLAIEGKIEGAGHVRIAGKFKGDVNVQGDLTIEKGAKLSGGVRAKKVTVAGELEGNIESAERVDLQPSAVLVGDVKTGVLIVNAGSKIRGHIECGWGEVKSAGSGSNNAKDKAAANDKSSDAA